MVWYQHNRKFRNIYICTRYFKGNKHSLYCRTSIYGSGICMLYMSHHLQWSLPETYVCSKLVVLQKLLFALLVCGSSGESRGIIRHVVSASELTWFMRWFIMLLLLKLSSWGKCNPGLFLLYLSCLDYDFLAPTNSFGFLIS